MFFVKTVYTPESGRRPNITRYTEKKTAERMIQVTNKWGFDIVTCEFIGEEAALTEVRAKEVEYDRA